MKIEAENFFVTLIKIGRRTKESVIAQLKANIATESSLLQQSIERNGSFYLLDVLNHTRELKKYTDDLFVVINYQPEPAVASKTESKYKKGDLVENHNGTWTGHVLHDSDDANEQVLVSWFGGTGTTSYFNEIKLVTNPDVIKDYKEIKSFNN